MAPATGPATPSFRGRLVGTLALVVLAAASHSPATELWNDYWKAVERFQQGDSAASEAALAALAPAGLGRVKERLNALQRSAERCTACPEREELQARPCLAAALLHAQRGWALPAGMTAAISEQDLALAFAKAARLQPRNASLVHRWFVAMTLKAHARVNGRLALAYAQEGLRLFPDDPELLLAHGTVLEALAGFSSLGVEQPLKVTDSQRTRLVAAEKVLAVALRANPLLEEPHVRLGRVRLLLGDPDGASELRPIAEQGKDPSWVYLARLFLGGLAEARERIPEAMSEYRAALAVVPHAQAAHVALSHALGRSGNLASARRELEAGLAAGKARREPDPFWRYPWGRSADADRLLEELRRSLP